jgi:sigma-B regulation protein RsbQ
MSVLRTFNVNIHGVDGPPMLFAHGFGCDQNMWRHVWPAFADQYRIILFDYIGFGRSDASAYRRDRYASLNGLATDVLAICEELDLRSAVLVGHSVSAMIGALAAIRAPDRIGRLVMVGPSPRYIDDEGYVGGFSRQDIDGLLEFLDSNYLGWSQALAPKIMGNPDRPELGEELANSFCQAHPEVAKQFARITFLSDNRADLPKVKQPTLVLQCSEDIIAPQAVGRYVEEHLPNAQFEQLSATGHCPNLSAPAETVAAIKRFLA